MTSPIHIPYDSNLVFLPIMYLIPEDSIDNFPTLRKLPRKIRNVFYNDEMRTIVDTDQFLNEITEAIAQMVFPHLGVRGKYTHYTGYNTLYFVLNQSIFWVQILEKYTGLGLNTLFQIPSSEEIPFYDSDYVNVIMKNVVEKGLFENEDIQPLLDVMREFPCHEDTVHMRSYVRIDFLRKWYHTRTKTIMVSFEEHQTGTDDDYQGKIVPDMHDMTEHIASEDFCQRFKATLSDKDRQILELREDGYKLEEIASMLGYKNHSGVVKRMQAIKKAYLEYEAKYK